MAMLAGLPKAPSAYNPIVNPERPLASAVRAAPHARVEFHYPDQYDAAIKEPLHLASASVDANQPALYVAEMVRQAMYERYKDAAYTEGYKVYTTLDSHHQQWAMTHCVPA
jgi:penicillin-binding protein 1A